MRQNFGPFVALSQFFEQGAAFNSLNMNLTIWNYPNTTTTSIGMSVLWCPSDGQIAGLRYQGQPGDGWDNCPMPWTFSSYAGNSGPFVYQYNSPNLSQTQGIFAHSGNVLLGGTSSFPPVAISGITDGTSNTILFGEHAHTLLASSGTSYYGINPWFSGDSGDTLFGTVFPPNYFTSYAAYANGVWFNKQLVARQTNFADTAGSMHPGGANFALCDGSVRFIKSTINSWNPSLVVVTGGGSSLTYTSYPRLGTYQALSTRAGGEVISADQF
jgi:prepilin-type processing-associated H-X9-DG protein